MTAEDLLDDLRKREVAVTIRGDHLRVEAPRGVLTEELRSALSEHKPALLRLLRSTPEPQGGLSEAEKEGIAAMSLDEFFVDATGLGQPLIDLLDDETTCISPITGVYLFHGDQLMRDGRKVYLGKAYLVSRLQVLLQTGRLHLPRTADCEQLAQELLDYEIQVDEKANERYGAFRVGSRDDQVTALGLAVHNEPHLPGVY
jgi:hypothetical protein